MKPSGWTSTTTLEETKDCKKPRPSRLSITIANHPFRRQLHISTIELMLRTPQCHCTSKWRVHYLQPFATALDHCDKCVNSVPVSLDCWFNIFSYALWNFTDLTCQYVLWKANLRYSIYFQIWVRFCIKAVWVKHNYMKKRLHRLLKLTTFTVNIDQSNFQKCCL